MTSEKQRCPTVASAVIMEVKGANIFQFGGRRHMCHMQARIVKDGQFDGFHG